MKLSDDTTEVAQAKYCCTTKEQPTNCWGACGQHKVRSGQHGESDSLHGFVSIVLERC